MNPIEQSLVLTKDDCKNLIRYFESNLCKKHIRESQYGYSGIHGEVISEYIPLDIFDKLKVFKIKPFNWNYYHSDNNALVIHKYSLGDGFPPHKDDNLSNFGSIDTKRTYRFKTLIFQLSESSDYQGGEFIVNNQIMNNSIGNCICFDSNLVHEVKPITEGIRYSMSLWLEKKDFDLKYSLL